MKTNFLAVAMAIGPVSVGAAESRDFDTTVTQFKAAYQCAGTSTSPPSYEGDGRLFSCVDGKNQTAKYFINEDGKSNRIKNIKLIWNDWFKDAGHGLHSDKVESENMLSVAMDIYGPSKKGDALAAFRSDKPWSATADGVTFAYRYRRGPAIDERLMTITPAP